MAVLSWTPGGIVVSREVDNRDNRRGENKRFLRSQGSYTFFKVKFKHFSSIFKVHFLAFPAPYSILVSSSSLVRSKAARYWKKMTFLPVIFIAILKYSGNDVLALFEECECRNIGPILSGSE